ncbi:MAG: hypothetical protein HON34_05035 [Pelagibacteraceae bacterium]|jgi:hypothetical protein|nr:hypothetical protein [Gammaproteobacteria bacterium]MBT4951147.1 hypothetical protein [Pelagibacteraceae bacterium]
MKSFAEKNIRYLLEFIVIISGVFLSFYLDDIRELGQKKQYKDTLIEELIITSNQDLLQLEKVITALNKVELSIDRLLVDIVEGDNNLSDKEIAEDYLEIRENMNFSFYPLNGIFDQLISTGSFELIESIELRRLLMDNYTHFTHRNDANNRSLDDLWLSFVENIDPMMLIIPIIDKDIEYIYASQEIGSYDIDLTFYSSKKFIAYLVSAKTSVSTTLDMLLVFEKNYNQIIKLAESKN